MGFFEVSRGAQRRARIRAKLPTEHPPVLDAIDGLLDGLPDPELLCAEQRAGALAALAAIGNRVDAYLSAVAGAADSHGDSRVLAAGTTGTLVAAATGSTVAAGSAIVATARDLAAFPELARAFAAGQGVQPARGGDPGDHRRCQSPGADRGRGRGPGRGHRPAGNPACAAGDR